MAGAPDNSQKRRIRQLFFLSAAIDIVLAGLCFLFGEKLLGLGRDIVVLIAIALAAFALFSAIAGLVAVRPTTEGRKNVVERG